MIKRFFKVALMGMLITSCVAPKVYKNLEQKYKDLKAENAQLLDESATLLQSKTKAENALKKAENQYQETLASKAKLEQEYQAIKSNHNLLKASYNALEENSSKSIAANSKKNRALLANLEAKEQALAMENARLVKLKETLERRSNRVVELEQVIASKDAAMATLKNAVSKALTDFEGKGLTVEQRDGKVYVSMENKLLFSSGSWAVGAQGEKAVKQLGQVLANNKDIVVLIEGHTDNVPYGGQGALSSNWDLSAKRATSIVAILQKNKSINPSNLTVAGRGEFAPIASNNNTQGRAKNRRIEVVLTPKLDKLSQLLNDN